MTAITHTPVTLTDHEEAGDVYSVTIFANELSRDGVSVDIDGMDFSNYRKNPVVLFAHDYSGRTESSGLPIGRTVASHAPRTAASGLTSSSCPATRSPTVYATHGTGASSGERPSAGGP